MKAFSYLRVSGKGQIDGGGFTRQRDTIAKRCKAAGIKIVQEFIELGVTGTSEMDDRPALSALFEAIMANGVRLVIVERSDRFSRDLMVGEVLLAQFRDVGVTVIEAEDGRDLTANDPDNATGTLVRQILAVIAQFEKTSIVAKLRKARARKRAEVGRCEGRKPFGEREGEAAVLALIRSLRRKPKGGDRMPFKAIADKLNADGVPTRTGRPWHGEVVRRLLGGERSSVG